MKKQMLAVLFLAVVLSPFFANVLAASPGDDWSMFRGDLKHAGYSTTAPATSNEALWKFDTGSTIGASPTIVDGKVYIASNAGSIYCLNAKDGSSMES